MSFTTRTAIVSAFGLLVFGTTNSPTFFVSANLLRNGRFRNGNGQLSYPSDMMSELEHEQQAVEEAIDREEDLVETMQALGVFNTLSLDPLPPTPSPTATPVEHPSEQPSEQPSLSPSATVPDTAEPTISVQPSSPPTIEGTGTNEPSLSSKPSTNPTVSLTPTSAPTVSVKPSASPSVSKVPTSAPTISVQPSTNPTISVQPSSIPTELLELETDAPTELGPVTSNPTISTSPSDSPTLSECGITPVQRAEQIVAVLAEATNEDPETIVDPTTPQGLATAWLTDIDARFLCPDDEKLVQRWVMAVMYYSTNGDDWIQCSANGIDPCGTLEPFEGQTRFLSDNNECTWAGISCNVDACVTEIEFEENNVVGVIPTELGLLNDLAILGLEQGGLQGTIPTELGTLGDLVFLDLDFNFLTGSIPTEIYLLTNLTQLDLNDNFLTGEINDEIGNIFVDLEFLQLHTNFFEGTVPESLGNSILAGTMTFHENDFGGAIPESICELREPQGVLESLIADCAGEDPIIECNCCTSCRPLPPTDP